jgi:hypothetical protein
VLTGGDFPACGNHALDVELTRISVGRISLRDVRLPGMRRQFARQPLRLQSMAIPKR